MEIRIEKTTLDRHVGPKWDDFEKFDGYKVEVSFNGHQWQGLGIDGGLTIAEVIQLRDKLDRVMPLTS